MSDAVAQKLMATTAERAVLLSSYAERFPTGRAVSHDDALDLLRRTYVPPQYQATELAELVTRGLVVRQDDGTYLRVERPVRHVEAAVVRAPEHSPLGELHRAVLPLIDQRLRELGLIS
jgi:hypothetical protein